MNASESSVKKIGIRYIDYGRDSAAIQVLDMPWKEFAEVFRESYWSYPIPLDGDEIDDTQMLEDEFTGDQTWLTLATGADAEAEPTQVHALNIEVNGLSRDTLQERFQGLAAIAHTLYLHCPSDPTWRVIVPLVEPVSPEAAEALVERLFTDKLDGGLVYIDTSQDRAFTRPGCRSDLADYFDHFTLDGMSIDAEGVLSGAVTWTGKACAYPEPSVAITRSSDPALDAGLEGLAARVQAHVEDYIDVREQWLALEFEVNRRGRRAPAWRPQISVPRYEVDRKPVHTVIHQDRVVIDCHWLHQTCDGHVANEVHWQPLLDSAAPFPRPLAEEFAARTIAGEVRAEEILCLSLVQQIQTRTLKGAKARGVQKRSEQPKERSQSELAKTISAINRWASKDRRIKDEVEKYVALARATTALADEGCSWSELAKVVGLMRGKPRLSESTTRDQMARLKKAVGRYSGKG